MGRMQGGMAEKVRIARTLNAWWGTLFLYQMCRLSNPCSAIVAGVPGDFPKKKLQRRFLAALSSLDPVDPDNCPAIGFLRRISAWPPPPRPLEVAQLIGNIR
eukprot:8365113-Pyramimonas_sp.AAC.1